MANNTQIQQLEARLQKEFKEMRGEIAAFKEDVDGKLQPIHDFMVGQQAIAGTKSPQSVTSKDLMVFVLKLIAGIAAVLASAAWISRVK